MPHLGHSRGPDGGPAGLRQLTILCPLAVERQAILRSAAWAELCRGADPLPTIAVCGPGPHAVERWFAEQFPTGERLRGDLLLMGVGGGLSAAAGTGSANFVARVVDRDGATLGELHVPPSAATSRAAPPWRVVSVERPVNTPSAKRALAERSGADVVDMESAAFVRAVERLGPNVVGRASILRGISDGPEETLPEGLDALVDGSGRTRIGAAIALLARRPLLLPALRALGQRTNEALGAAVALLPSLRATSAPSESVR